MRLTTKNDRQSAREAWISGQVTEKYKNIEILKKDTPYIGLVIWKGTAGNPYSNYSYRTIEQRDDAIEYAKKRADERERYTTEQTAQRKEAQKKALNHGLKKGDMFVTSWGYDQTNYDYIVVIEVSKTGKTVKCQRTSFLHHGQSCRSNIQEPIFCPFGDVFTMQIRGYDNSFSLVGSYPFCHDGTGSKRRGHFSRAIEGIVYHETIPEFGH